MRNQLFWASAVLGLLGLAPLARAGDGACCEAGACGKKVCVPGTGEAERRVHHWDIVCEDFCKPPCCYFFGHLFGGCKDCCGKPCPRRILVVKWPREKRCIGTCTPAIEAPCQSACAPSCCVSGQPVGTLPAPVVGHPVASLPGPAVGQPVVSMPVPAVGLPAAPQMGHVIVPPAQMPVGR
jgi:hypothetical protein